MYLLIFILPLLLLFLLFNHFRRKKITKKICAMCMSEKCTLINELLEPFGYCYIPSQDLFSTRIDAWQRQMGYCSIFDKAASRFQMIFDSLPIYFDYQGRTWLMEAWKGQYGINTGGEVGLYYADRILPPKEREHIRFTSVSDKHLVRMSMVLIRDGVTSAQLSACHWWLTAFRPGCFSHPKQLALHVSITFPTCEMAEAFCGGLLRAGYSRSEIKRNRCTVRFVFNHSQCCTGWFRHLRIRITQCLNRFWCKVFCFVTRHFCLTLDRVLYLYYYLPFAFRKTLQIRKYKKRWKRKTPR